MKPGQKVAYGVNFITVTGGVKPENIKMRILNINDPNNPVVIDAGPMGEVRSNPPSPNHGHIQKPVMEIPAGVKKLPSNLKMWAAIALSFHHRIFTTMPMRR